MTSGHDFIASLGALALALRLRRLADRLADDGRRVYQALDTALEPGWYAALLLLDRYGAQSISESAQQLGVRHPSMVKISKALEAAGLVVSAGDPRDARRRVLKLSRRARRGLPEFRRIWDGFAAAFGELSDGARGDLLQ
ncbi:MAG: MarR family transcriptional regulator [Myxococcota bacterium]